MTIQKATVRANSNIAFIKYWGNADDTLRIPANGSISMNLDGLYTQTAVTWDETLHRDELTLNNELQTGKTLERVTRHLSTLRERTGIQGYARVESTNNFPMGAGIASSASSFAALTMAAITAKGLSLPEYELTMLARLGSGSAARSIPGGFVQWHKGESHETSFAESIAPSNYWELTDAIAIVSGQHKATGSTEGHQSAHTSDLQNSRVKGAPERLRRCKTALLNKDFASFATVVEEDSNLMHAVMMTSRPPLFYWMPASLAIMQAVRQWRAEGLEVCYTLDAGPNVHCICVRKAVDEVINRLKHISGVIDVRRAEAGSGAYILSNP